MVELLSYIFAGFAFFRTYANQVTFQNSPGQDISFLNKGEIEEFKPYSYYAAAAYCDPSDILKWSCGGWCHRLTLKNIWRLINGVSPCVGFQWTARETLISSLPPQVEMGTQSNFVRITITIWGGTDHGAGYVGWDPSLSSVIVAHQGTNPIKLWVQN